MGKKGGGGSPPSGRFILLSRFILLQRIESCKLNTGILSIDQIVESLRTTFPDYRRMKQQPFTKYVFQTLEQKRPKSRKNESDEDEDEDHKPQISPIRSPARKKVRKSDLDEERLAKKHSTSSSSSYSSDDGAVSTSSWSSYSSDDGAVSTSEDASFEVPFEPDIDLTKSLLRSSYGGVSQPVATEKNVELETVKKGRKIDSADVVRAEKNLADKRRKDFKGSSGTTVTENEGPMFRDIGGIKGVLDELMMEVIMPLKNPELPRWLGVKPMSGVLLHGPPGCGKTKLAHAIANETRVPFYKISATEVVSGVSGASEENIRDLFSKAYRTAPSIVFIDEIDAIASKRENLQREMECRIVTQLMTCMDESHQTICQSADVDSNLEVSEKRPGYVLVIGATNRPDAVDPALRRPGRFDQEIALGVPDENARMEILSVVMRNLRLEGSFDMKKIARSTPGFVGADLAALANKAGNLAMKRILVERKSVVHRELKYMDGNEEWLKCSWSPEEMERLSITMADFEEAIKVVRPSSRREGFSTIPNVKWEDVGGLHSLRKEFDEYIIMRIKYPEDYEEFGVDLETGFMLYGPPGCGKTLIAKAVANEAGANFIHIKGPELLNKYVGESELAVRTIFSRARTCAPCVLFFDEMDAITSERGKDGGWVIERLLNQLLIELDGADQRRGVYVIGATNRLEVVDRAVLRPGRLGKLLYVPVPSPDDRGLILKAIAREKPLAADVDLDAIGRSAACENLSGADLAAVVNEAAMAALREKRMAISEGTSRTEPWEIKTSHFELAVKKISPSVSAEQRRHYEVKFGNITMA